MGLLARLDKRHVENGARANVLVDGLTEPFIRTQNQRWSVLSRAEMITYKFNLCDLVCLPDGAIAGATLLLSANA